MYFLYAVHTREPSWFSTSRYDTIANANRPVPLRTAPKIDHLFEPCRAVLTRVDELCTLQTTNDSTINNHVTIDHTQQIPV